MRRLLVGFLLLALPAPAVAQAACDGEPLRNTLKGAALGAGIMAGVIAVTDRDHRISASERLPYVWGITANASLFGGLAYQLAERRCPGQRVIVLPDSLRSCAGSAARGGVFGAALGGLEAFDMAPIAVLIVALPAALGGHPLNFDHAVGLTTAAGAAIGAPIGAIHGYHACKG